MTIDQSKIINNIELGDIRASHIHGYGLFSNTFITKGTILGFLDGQVIKWDDYDKISFFLKQHISNIQEYLFMEWNALAEDTLLVRAFRTKYSFINHSRDPNIVLVNNPLRLVALSNIETDTELFLDYRKEPLRKEYLQGHGKSYL